MTSRTRLRLPAVLAEARRSRVEADRAEAAVIAAAVEWALLNRETDPELGATWGDTPVLLGGEGAPMVSEFAITELATALGMGREAGRHLIAEGLELACRLPRVWARVQTGSLQTWRARNIAAETLCLSMEAAAFVDAQVANYAHRLGVAGTQRLVDEAIARFMPEFAKDRREAAADGRHFSVERRQVSFAGTAAVHGELDLRDALDLEDAIAAGAAQLAELGNEDCLNTRRAAAVGNLARGEVPLPLTTLPDVGLAATPAPQHRPPTAREVVLYVHLDGSGLAKVEGHGLLTVEQIRTWCGTSKVTIKPVIDLDKTISTSAYQVPERIREHIILRNGTCVFPWCTRAARRADIDHIDAFNPDGPAAQTNTENLAALCRHHHRIKTHGNWTYTQLEPGTFLWRSPYGYTYLRDGDGTDDLTPRPVDPPGS